VTQEELTQIKQMLEQQLAARMAPTPTAIGMAWPPAAAPVASAPPQPVGVMLRVNIAAGGGELGGYLCFTPDVLLSPQTLAAVVTAYGIQLHQPRPTWPGPDWQSGGGGYPRRPYGRRW
jgi:hypothetical protein